MKSFGLFLSRILLAGIFLLAGVRKILHFAGIKASMAQHGIPWVGVLAVITIILEIGGAICLILGWNTRVVAFLLFLFLIPVTLIYHLQWSQAAQLISFFKNLAIMGGLLGLVVHGPGPWSMDERFL